MARELPALRYLKQAINLLEHAVQTEDQQIREFLADCAADLMRIAAERSEILPEYLPNENPN